MAFPGGTQHSEEADHSQYLLSLPNLQHVFGNVAVGLPGGSITPLSLWSGGETEEAGTSRFRAGTCTGFGSVFCLSQPQTITDSQLQLAVPQSLALPLAGTLTSALAPILLPCSESDSS